MSLYNWYKNGKLTVAAFSNLTQLTSAKVPDSETPVFVVSGTERGLWICNDVANIDQAVSWSEYSGEANKELSNLTDSSWQTIPVDPTNVTALVTYVKKIGDRIIVRAYIRIEPAATVNNYNLVLTLPVGYRPTNIKYLTATRLEDLTVTPQITPEIVPMTINTDGNIAVFATETDAVYSIDHEFTQDITGAPFI